MTQPKYISILKMSIIHLIAAFLSVQLVESLWMIEHLDAIHSAQNTFLPYNKYPFDTIYSDTGAATNRDSNYRIRVYDLFVKSNVVLAFLSNLKIGHKWYFFISSLIVSFFASIIREFLPLSRPADFSYNLLFSNFDNTYLIVYGNTLLISSIVLFLYFGKPIINFIRNDYNPISDKRLDDILDA